jgi:hypothetical protein
VERYERQVITSRSSPKIGTANYIGCDLQTCAQFGGARIEITRSDSRPVTPLRRILHSVTCRSIKLLKLSDDIFRKLDVVTTDQVKSTTKLFVDGAQGD